MAKILKFTFFLLLLTSCGGGGAEQATELGIGDSCPGNAFCYYGTSCKDHCTDRGFGGSSSFSGCGFFAGCCECFHN